MSIRVVDPNEERDKKEKFAVKLELLAKEIRESGGAPRAVFVHLFRADGTISRMKNVENDFNVLEGMGIFQFTVNELSMEVQMRVNGPK